MPMRKKRKGQGSVARRNERRGYGAQALALPQAPSQPTENDMIDVPLEDPQPNAKLSTTVVESRVSSTPRHPQASPEEAFTVRRNISHQAQPRQPDENIYSYALAIIESTPFTRGMQDIGRYTPNQADNIIRVRASGIVTQFDETAATNCLQRDGCSADERFDLSKPAVLQLINLRDTVYMSNQMGNVSQQVREESFDETRANSVQIPSSATTSTTRKRRSKKRKRKGKACKERRDLRRKLAGLYITPIAKEHTLQT